MTKMPRMRGISIFLVVLWALLAASSARSENLKISVFHTNDIHGWIMARPASFHAADPKRMIGGAAAMANVYRHARGPKLLIDAGDWFQGTPEGNVTKGRSLVEVFNALPYDVVEIGNHEFDYGEENLKALIKAMKIPVLGANVYREKDRQRAPYLKPWIIKDVAGVKVGIFGLLTTNMRNLAFSENIAGLSFRREVDEARDDVKALKAAGATVIIAVTHVGFENPSLGSFEGDQTLASEVDGIDVIVGGHTHTALKEPVRDAAHGTLIVQTGWSLTSLGEVTLEIDPRTKKVVSSSGRLEDLWIDQVGQDARIAKIVRKHADAVSQAYDVVIATAEEAMTRSQTGESSLGDWMTDCEREWSGADLAVQNAGGIRSDMAAGSVSLRAIYDIMPFDNRMVKLKMSGRLVQDLLDHGVGKSKGMIQISGAEFSYSRDKDAGRRLSDVRIGGKPLDAGASYSVATIDFLVRGGDGYTPFDLAESKDFTRIFLRDVLGACARKHSPLRAPPAGRMRPLGS